MKRFLELVELVKTKYPTDRFFENFNEDFEFFAQARDSYLAYESALQCLDEKSWDVLRGKAASHFRDHRKGQLKQGFYNQLNDAFAYQFLKKCGYDDIRVLPEEGKVTPDLSFKDGEELQFCEVKTICRSDEDIERFEKEQVFDGNVYYELSPQFLDCIRRTIDGAVVQINQTGKSGVVFLIINFDDFSLSHYQTYERQITSLLQEHNANEIFVKIGILGDYFIHKTNVSIQRVTRIKLHSVGRTLVRRV